MATRTSVPKKVRLACQRCRARRIKCDGQIPACSNCTKAGQVCLDIDSQNSDVVIPRNFVSAARERIRWLEAIIKERAPDVDLASGPQIEAPADAEARTLDEAGNDNNRTPATPGPLLSHSSARRSSQKRSADAFVQSEYDESFPERAHSVALNLGMLSLNSDSPQKHYLGSSSGLLFTNLIGASPSSAGSTPQGTGNQDQPSDLEWQDSSPREQTENPYRDLYAFLRQELPPKRDALVLVHTYVRWIHPDFPVLEPAAIFSVLDAIYCSLLEPLEVSYSKNGWPSTMSPFRWNGRQVVPGVNEDGGVTMPAIAFILFMVLNLGSIVKVRSRVYEFPPQKFYRAAIYFSKDAFGQVSLSSIQALVMLVMHSMLTPAEVNLWTLVHLGLAYCVELGIHREQTQTSPEDFAFQQIRKFTFFTIYGLDRSLSSIQGRPLGFRDETFDLEMPQLPPPHLEPTDGNIPSSFTSAVTHYAIYKFRLDRIVSDIKLHFYHLPGRSSWLALPENPTESQERIKNTLNRWREDVLNDPFDFPSLDRRQREVWRLKLKINYHTTMVLLFQPSQVIRTPSPGALALCFDNASQILDGYQRQHDLQSLHHGWRAVQNIFAAGATLIYSFWTSEQVQKAASTVGMSTYLRTCSSLLTVGGEWWPSAKTGQRSFGSVADLTMRKLYTDNVQSKAARLASSSSASSQHNSERIDRQEDSVIDLEQVMVLEDRDHASLDDQGNAWHQMGTMVDEDSGRPMWQGVERTTGQDLEFAPEVEMFLADFDRSDFTWNFPLNSNDGFHQFGTGTDPAF